MTKTLKYLDPPYIGQSKRHYGDHPDYAGEVDHKELVRTINDGCDGWVLHLSSSTLPVVLNYFHYYGVQDSEYRIMPWVKPFAAFKPNVPVAYAWEPCIVKPVRKPVVSGRMVMRDWCAENITMQRGVHGAKPERLCHWLFEVSGMQPGDTLLDVYPGSGAVTHAWLSWEVAVSRGEPLSTEDESRESRLPKWAQETLSSLRAEILHREIERA